VVPLRIGGGTRLKILEAMALGTPVVSTTKGAEGLRVVSGEHLLLADTSRSFAEQTVRLLRQPELRADLAMRARRLVEREYDWADIGQHFRDLVEELAGPPSVERHALSGGAWA
jgi:glycosyltransferase involved in cell wall biosynthesis